MRANRELAKKTGLLPNMRIYKFFRIVYEDCKEKKRHRSEKIHQPKFHSYTFINNDFNCIKQFEKEFAPYFTDELKFKKLPLSNLTPKNKPNFIWQTKKN